MEKLVTYVPRKRHVRYLYRKEVFMPLSVRLTDDENARLDRLAARTGRSKTFYVREAIRMHLSELEERYWAETAVKEWEASGRQVRPIEELWTELGE